MTWMGQSCIKCGQMFTCPSVMDGLRSAWRRDRDPSKVFQRSDKLSISETLMGEVEFHIHELDNQSRLEQRDQQRRMTGVDYSWLISETPKVYRIPQFERLELEELCLKLETSECSKVVTLFRDCMLREVKAEDLPRIMRTCVIQVLEQRPKPPKLGSSVTNWVNRRTSSLWSLKQKRVGPAGEENDIEMQNENISQTSRTFSVPNFAVSQASAGEVSPGAYPV